MKTFLFKNQKRKIVVIIELVLLLCTILTYFIPRYTETKSGDQINEWFKGMRCGRYVATVEYTNNNIFAPMAVFPMQPVEKPWYSWDIQSGVVSLSPYYTTQDVEVWVKCIKTDFRFTNFSDFTDFVDGQEIYSITLRETHYLNSLLVLGILFVMGITVVAFFIIDGRILIDRKRFIIILMLLGITALSSVPLFSKYTSFGMDTTFHLVRIEGMKEALLSGQFPVRVEGTYLNNGGYGVSLFYGNLFFYLPAVMRIIGFPLQTAFKTMLFLANFLATLGSYLFFKEFYKGRKWGVIGAFFFATAYFRFISLHYRGAVAECLAMSVMPFFALSLYNVFTKPYDEKYKARWIPLTLSFSAILETHLISTEIYGIAAMVVCAFNLKKTFNKQTFMVLLKFVGATFVLNLYFLGPFIQCMSELSLVVNNLEEMEPVMQNTGASWDNIFGFHKPVECGGFWFQQVYIYGLGYVTRFSIAAFIISLPFAKLKEKRVRKQYYLWGIGFALVTVMATYHFPWDSFMQAISQVPKLGKLVIKMITTIQFLFRLLVLDTFFLAGITIQAVAVIGKRQKYVGYALALILAVISYTQVFYAQKAELKVTEFSKDRTAFIYDCDSDNNYAVGFYEYLPVLEDGDTMSLGNFDVPTYFCVNCEVENFRKIGTKAYVDVRVSEGEFGIIEFPCIFYPGYTLKDLNTGKKLEYEQAGGGRVMTILGSGDYQLRLSYTGEAMWRVYELISLAFLGFMCWYQRKISKAAEIKNE